MAAAGLGQREVLEALLASLEPGRESLDRALSVALKYRHWATTEVLLRHDLPLDREIVHAGTPLHHAALANDRECCQRLLALGARLDIRDRLWNGTPADWASHGGGHAKLAQWLKDQERAANRQGQT